MVGLLNDAVRHQATIFAEIPGQTLLSAGASSIVQEASALLGA